MEEKKALESPTPTPVSGHISGDRDGDKRWAKQFGDFGEMLSMFVLGRLKNMTVALIDHVGADLIAVKREDPSVRYAISVKSRIIRTRTAESYGFEFDRKNIDYLTETAEFFGMVPAVSFVFVDTMEGPRKIRMMVVKLSDLFELRDDPSIKFVSRTGKDGIYLAFTIGRNVNRIAEIRQCGKIAYFEMEFTSLEDVQVFGS